MALEGTDMAYWNYSKVYLKSFTFLLTFIINILEVNFLLFCLVELSLFLRVFKS